MPLCEFRYLDEFRCEFRFRYFYILSCHSFYINLFYSLQAWCAAFMQSDIEKYRRYLFIGCIGILFYISSTSQNE